MLNKSSSISKKKQGFLIALIFILIGAGVSSYAGKSLYERYDLFLNGVLTEGTVIKHIVTGRRTEAKIMRVKFKTQDGNIIRFREHIPEKTPRFAVGDKVPVRYDPLSPQTRAIIADDSLTPVLPMLFMFGIGAFFAVMGLGVISYYTRPQRM